MLKLKPKFIVLNKKQVTKYLLIFTFIVAASLIAKPTVQSVFNQTTAKPAKKSLPIYSVNTDQNKVAISFDAAWGADDTDELLKILKDNDVKTTFFLCGYWIDKYPDEVKKIYEQGHDIGNHSNTHPHGAQLSLEQNKEEIMNAHKKVKDLLGVDMELYRPPFGEYNDTVLKAAQECNYYSIQWDVDSLDWKEKGRQAQIDQVLNNKLSVMDLGMIEACKINNIKIKVMNFNNIDNLLSDSEGSIICVEK